jgi:VWFA-related protein
MRLSQLVFVPAVVWLAAGLATGQDAAQTPPNAASGTPIRRAESRLVVVDAVVTDKKGNDLRDLAPGQFHVLEDNQEQSIKSVSRESVAGAQSGTPAHIVLLFGKMNSSELIYARERATQFIDSSVSPKRLMAILSYLDAGNVKVTQGFTADALRLKQAVMGMKTTGVVAESTVADHTGEVFTGPRNEAQWRQLRQMGRDTAEGSDFTGRSLLAAVRDLAKNLGSVSGRKALVLIAPTFNYNLQPHDFPAAISACNKANVAVYTVDVRGNSNSLIQNTLDPLVTGTGGFASDTPNDAPRALQRIARDQDERYVIAYAPSKSAEESCHSIKVKVDRGEANVRARSEYCNVNPNDPLAGTQIDRDLEARAAATQPGNVPASMQSTYFYTASDAARVHVAADISTAAFAFEKQNGKLHATLNVIGVAYRPDGTIGSRFSDTVDFDFENKDRVEQFKRRPYQYEKQFAAAAGRYDLRLVFSAGRDDFAKLEVPLAIDLKDDKRLALSGLALCREFNSAADPHNAGASLLVESVPLMSRGTQFVPSGTTRFKKTDTAGVYFELYEPRLQETRPTSLQFRVQVFDRKSGQLKSDSEPMTVALAKWADPVIPVGWKLAIDKLIPGSYRIDVNASDSKGSPPLVRSAEFEIE